jgi:hypothetical protein
VHSHLTYVCTGYKLRVHIAAGLKRRSEAIRNALGRYNMQAARLDPPREPLDWKTVITYTFLSEFDLLQFSHEDIREKQWAQPAIRDAVIKHFKLRCAQAEIDRLNVETP